jgi:transketolase
MSSKLIQTRESYGKALVELAGKDKNVVALDCDLGRSTKAYNITAVDPGRFFEMGIAEQDMVSTAAGLACAGKIPFANSFAVFITGRAFDQIRQQVSLPALNVKICGSSAGITQGTDGATHQSVLDVALMRALPNMTVLSPADGLQTEKAVQAAYELNGPVYLRLSRFPVPVFTQACGFTVGKAEALREGRDIAVCATGPVTWNVLKACEILNADGFEAAVFNFHTVKPIDREMIRSIAGRFSHVFTVEEHSIYGGLGSAVAEVLAEIDAGSKRIQRFRRIGISDHFGESGTADELLTRCKLDPEGIAASIRTTVQEQ